MYFLLCLVFLFVSPLVSFHSPELVFFSLEYLDWEFWVRSSIAGKSIQLKADRITNQDVVSLHIMTSQITVANNSIFQD